MPELSAANDCCAWLKSTTILAPGRGAIGRRGGIVPAGLSHEVSVGAPTSKSDPVVGSNPAVHSIKGQGVPKSSHMARPAALTLPVR